MQKTESLLEKWAESWEDTWDVLKGAFVLFSGAGYKVSGSYAKGYIITSPSGRVWNEDLFDSKNKALDEQPDILDLYQYLVFDAIWFNGLGRKEFFPSSNP